MSLFRPSKQIRLEDLHCKTVRESNKNESKERILSYKMDPDSQNNELHIAVLNNDTATVIKILAKSDEKTLPKLLSKTSKLNTPLLLALKHGNITIAKLLLEKMKKNENYSALDCKDGHGLTALDWACIMRENEIIKLILEGAPNLDKVEGLSDLGYDSGDDFAPVLYECNFGRSLHNFVKLIEDTVKSPTTMDVDIVASFFAENKGLPLSAAAFSNCEPLSDMRYFMRNICINSGFLKEEDFKKADQQSTSHMKYYQAFLIGYQIFSAERDKKPIDPKLLKAMQSQDNLYDFLEKLDQEKEAKKTP